MTQEEKDLLLKDLCARLYTGTIVNYNDLEGCDYELSIRTLSNFPEESLKCYLRPMSSMTKEERKELAKIFNYEFYVDDDFALVAEDDRHRIRIELMEKYIDWLLEHHFDYCGLIDKELALEAPEGMYKTDKND